MKTTSLESVFTSLCPEAPAEPLAVLAARLADALERSIRHILQANDQNPGHLEVQAAHELQELLSGRP